MEILILKFFRFFLEIPLPGIITILLFEILFSEKNIFTFFNNFDLIYEYENNLKNKKKEFETLNNFLNNFEGSDELKKIVIKDKLFYKDKNEKVYLYD